MPQTTVQCLEDIPEGYKLEEGDTVIFSIHNGPNAGLDEYYVGSQYLSCRTSGDNDTIFTKLGLYKRKVSQEEYGYTPGDGNWPEYRTNDHLAITRLVKRL